ncbi:MAG: glycosyl hydrolase family 28-related protein [Reichenbachiella sp.]|uniref:glycosyl hydrolase family 28-related protein n=2 Tax=Reichenbachiella sp. TaxID=2184521 RepID=UPI0032991820
MTFSLKMVGTLVVCLYSSYSLLNEYEPKIISDESIKEEVYLPDYSFAGYRFSEEEIPSSPKGKIIDVIEFGALPDDGLDDSRAILTAMAAAHEVEGPVVVQLPPGKLILSEIIYIRRSNLVLRGAGSGQGGTTIFCPRPMSFLKNPPELKELREYLIELNKRQREPENNIDLPFSQYAWSGGMIWTMYPGARVKNYLNKYDEAPVVLAKLAKGKKGRNKIECERIYGLKVGDIVQIEWFNNEGPEGSLIQELYNYSDLKVGSHHWNYPEHPLVVQQVQVTSIDGLTITIKDPLLQDVRSVWNCQMTAWNHLEEVGIEHFKIEFPMAPNIAHHVEDGYNGIYLTRLFNSWVSDVRIENADSGILTEESANVTIRDIITLGDKKAHYSVSMGSVHNVLVDNLTVSNKVIHPLSFNTHATKSVYHDCTIYSDPILDQHSGANHQNLFDNIKVYVNLDQGSMSYPLFAGGGASYWKPSHGAFTTFWNIDVHFENAFDQKGTVLLDGMNDGASARLIGVHANRDIRIEYGANAYIEGTNQSLTSHPSLFDYQLMGRNQ